MRIEDILAMEESQTFDRKSVNIAPKDFSNYVCAFANADGGIIVVGISDKNRRIEGVDHREKDVNELLRVRRRFLLLMNLLNALMPKVSRTMCWYST